MAGLDNCNDGRRSATARAFGPIFNGVSASCRELFLIALHHDGIQHGDHRLFRAAIRACRKRETTFLFVNAPHRGPRIKSVGDPTGADAADAAEGASVELRSSGSSVRPRTPPPAKRA